MSVYDIIGKSDEVTMHLKDWNLDLCCVNSLLAIKNAHQVFELGTGFGCMTLQFSLNTPDDCQIHTLDIIPDQRGFIFKDKPSAKKITQLIGDSKTLDLTRFNKAMDFIFIDGGHDYETVMADSKKAFTMIAPADTFCGMIFPLTGLAFAQF